MNEKREKFLTLRDKRLEKARKSISSLGNLSTPAYDWEQAEIEQMLAELQSDLDAVRGRFERTRRWKA